MSKIEVDEITQQSGTTLTVGGGACKAATVDATTVTIGRSGGTVSLASGASQSGFGRTGTVDWNTTKKTANFDATNGDGFFVDTGSGAITATLPASPSAGNIVAFADYDGNFGTANLTIGRNGSNINGDASDLVMNKNDSVVQLIYVDATEGWRSVLTGNPADFSKNFVTASGGTETTSPCGNFKIHTFTGPGTFSVSQVADDAANNTVSYAVVGAGAGGGACGGGGGGAGGFREFRSPVDSYTVSPANGSTPITVSVTSFPITVGGGGAGACGPAGMGGNGNSSTFSSVTSAGGGGAGHYQPTFPAASVGKSGQAGGSGGGSGGSGPSGTNPGGSGNSPPVSPSQGNGGGNGQHLSGCCMRSGGGGGATGAGQNGTNQSPSPGHAQGGNGGTGATTHITGSPVAYAGGGGGAGFGSSGAGGTSPCGSGGAGTKVAPETAGAGSTNKGGGGGGGSHPSPGTGGANGGSGVVIIRYKIG